MQVIAILLIMMTFSLFADDVSSECNPNLKAEILQMRDLDQKMRLAYLKSGKSDEYQRQVKNVDQSHTVRLKAIIHIYGWPGIKLIGEDGSEAMWLLVQHTPDKGFQRTALEKLRIAVMKKDASSTNLAYLEDRVLMNEGKMQLYGTQWVEREDGKHYLYPVENFGQINVRRFSVGLESLEESRKKYAALYNLADEDVVINPGN